MAKEKRPRIWINKTIKKFAKWRATMSYNVKRGNRHAIMTNENGTTYVYESAKAAKDHGWIRE